jgi:hypothetical protein
MSAIPDRFTECSEEDHGGCDANDACKSTFGSGFNSASGGVYAVDWKRDRIPIWFFPRNTYPSGDGAPFSASPEPSTWGTPATVFGSAGGSTSCDINAYFKRQRIVINTTFCGAWARGTWASSGCEIFRFVFDDCMSRSLEDLGAMFNPLLQTVARIVKIYVQHYFACPPALCRILSSFSNFCSKILKKKSNHSFSRSLSWRAGLFQLFASISFTRRLSTFSATAARQSRTAKRSTLPGKLMTPACILKSISAATMSTIGSGYAMDVECAL